MQLSRHLRVGIVCLVVPVCQSALAAPAAGSAKAVADVFAPPMSRAAALTAAQDPVTQWRVSGADDSFRAVLGKWTARANASADAPTPRWRLIWDYPGEVPVDGEGGFDGDYKSAVKWLIASTSMLDTPLQPCFYSNNVVRVIRQTEKCDPSE